MTIPLVAVLDEHPWSRLPPAVVISFDVPQPELKPQVMLSLTELELTNRFITTLGKVYRSLKLVPHEHDVVLAGQRECLQNAQAWILWLSVLHSWARRFCFLPGDYDAWDAVMSTSIKHWENVGIMLQFTLSNSSDVAILDKRPWFGDYDPSRPNAQFKLTDHKLCMCIALRVPEQSVDWEELKRISRFGASVVSNATQTQRLIQSLVAECDKVKCAYAVVMDNKNTLVIQLSEPLSSSQPRSATCQLLPAQEHSATFCIAMIIFKYSRSLYYRGQLLGRGAANCELAWPIDNPTRFRDFDYYDLSQNRLYLKEFLAWRARQPQIVPAIRIGDLISVTGRYALPRQIARWRSQFPRYPLDKQERTRLNAWTKRRRPRDATTDLLLRDAHAVEFRVTNNIQDGNDHYSRVVRGHLQVSDGSQVSSQRLILKLFDERFFPVDLLYDYLAGEASFWVNFADQLVRREASVYKRLSKLQGSLIPWYYGCHEFELPDGCKVLGILMEEISGKTPDEIITEKMPPEEHKMLLTCIRGFIRVLNHSDITQTDWGLDHIICEPYTSPAAEAIRHRPVFLDFAFATQSSGIRAAMDPHTDVGEVGLLLGVGMESGDERKWWYARDECE